MKLPSWAPLAAAGLAAGVVGVLLVRQYESAAAATANTARIAAAKNCLAAWQDSSYQNIYTKYSDIPSSIYTACGFTQAEAALIQSGNSPIVAKQVWTDTGPDFNSPGAKTAISAEVTFISLLASA